MNRIRIEPTEYTEYTEKYTEIKKINNFCVFLCVLWALFYCGPSFKREEGVRNHA